MNEKEAALTRELWDLRDAVRRREVQIIDDAQYLRVLLAHEEALSEDWKLRVRARLELTVEDWPRLFKPRGEHGDYS